MTEKQKQLKQTGVQRYPIASNRTSNVHIITFNHLTRADHVVRISNLSVVGVGIESNKPIEQGLACFDPQVGGHKFGVVTWTGTCNDGYRAGIHFVTLPQDAERYLLKQIKQSCSHKLGDPKKIIAALLESIKREASIS